MTPNTSGVTVPEDVVNQRIRDVGETTYVIDAVRDLECAISVHECLLDHFFNRFCRFVLINLKEYFIGRYMLDLYNSPGYMHKFNSTNDLYSNETPKLEIWEVLFVNLIKNLRSCKILE